MTIPARAALDVAAAERARSGTENRGFVSETWGLLPIDPPRTGLPSSHGAWDEMAGRLPAMFGSVTGREALEELPELPADEHALPDEYLLRAASLLGHFAHAYVRVRPDPPERLPACVTQPWEAVCRRLGRDQTAFTYDDLVSYNWRLRDPTAGRRRLDELDVLTPVVGNAEERIFYMVQVEVMAETAPAIGAMVRAQEAVVAQDERALATEIALIIDVLDAVTHESFRKLDPNPHSPTYMDPVVWAKTVAPFAVAIDQGKHAISGAAAPIFQVMDVFIGRRTYASRVGAEAYAIRPGFSENLRTFMEALGAISVADAAVAGPPRLRGLWHSLMEAYCGDTGFLGVHKRKAYAFLEIAFKVGRSVTTGGFSGLFEDQTWDVAVNELEVSRSERWEGVGPWCPVAHVEGAGPLTGDGLAHLRLDVRDAGLRFLPGDRLAVQPRNRPDLVERTIEALRATGEEVVGLDGLWRAATGVNELSLRELIERGRIRPVGRVMAKALMSFAESDRLARIVNARTESAWELWDLLELMAEGGFDPRTLWRADPWEAYSLPRIVPPDSFRLYSLASAMDSDTAADHVELLAAELRYATGGTEPAPERERRGTASSFLARLADSGTGETVPVRVVSASRFRPPDDPSRPIVLFAGGAGVSAFRAFAAARAQQTGAGRAFWFLSTRSQRHRDLYAAEVGRAGRDRFEAIVTRPESADSPRRGIVELIGEHAGELTALAADPRVVFYVCGPAGFADAVLSTLERLVTRDAMRVMLASGRLQQDVFTSPVPPETANTLLDASDLAECNDEVHGYWTVIDGSVYDLSEFIHRHPGGAGILREVAGRDGTAAFRQIEHNVDPEIEAMLPMYQVGAVRRLDFGRRGAAVVGEAGLAYAGLDDAFRAWVRYLHLVVEIQNAVRHDFGVLDAVTVTGDEPGRMTFLKAQLLLETHQRFTDVYLPALSGAELGRLWALSTAFVAPHEDVRALEHALQLDPVLAAARAAATDGIVDRVRRLRSVGRADPAVRERVLADLAMLRTPLEEADSHFLVALKATIAAGVRLLEDHERATPEVAGTRLLTPLLRVPQLVAELHSAVASSIGTPLDGSARDVVTRTAPR